MLMLCVCSMYACNQSVVAYGANAAMAVVVWCGIYNDVVVVMMSERTTRVCHMR